MGDSSMSTGMAPEHTDPADPKGKGKAVEPPRQDMSMDEDDDDSGEEEPEEVSSPFCHLAHLNH